MPRITMSALELKIPPPIVTLVIAVFMWALSRVAPPFAAGGVLGTIAAVAIWLAGGGVSVAGAIAVRRAKTTLSPVKPESASSLVTDGIYQITRNPMYLGLLLLLIGWAVFLLNLWCLIGPVAFFAYVTRFQIKPEERVLTSLFGEQYVNYASQVQRWL